MRKKPLLVLFLPNTCHSLPFCSRHWAARAAPSAPQGRCRQRGGAGAPQPGRPRAPRTTWRRGGAAPAPLCPDGNPRQGGLGRGAVGQRRPSAPPGAARGRRARLAAAWPVGAPGAGDGAGRERRPPGQPCRGTGSGAGPGATTVRKREVGVVRGTGCRGGGGVRGCVRGTGRVLSGAGWYVAGTGCVRVRCGCTGAEG